MGDGEQRRRANFSFRLNLKQALVKIKERTRLVTKRVGIEIGGFGVLVNKSRFNPGIHGPEGPVHVISTSRPINPSNIISKATN